MLDWQIFMGCSILCQAIYLYGLRRMRAAAELAAAQRAVRRGQIRRMSFAALALLYMVYLFAPGYVGLLLPLVLVICLLVPNLVYNRLDRRACVDV